MTSYEIYTWNGIYNIARGLVLILPPVVGLDITSLQVQGTVKPLNFAI